VIPTLIFCASFTPQIAGRQQPNAAQNVRRAVASVESGAPFAVPDPDAADFHDPIDDSQGSVDLYGNDVTDAVAQYKFDGTGILYELHSPQTEVARLPSPQS
jgi:hypothetical protein